MKNMKKITKLTLLAGYASSAFAVDMAQSNNQVIGRSLHQAHENSMYAPFALPKDKDASWSAHVVGSAFYYGAVEQKEGEGLGAAALWSGSDRMNVTLSSTQPTAPNDATWLSGDQLGLGYNTYKVDGYMELDPISYQTGASFLLGLEAVSSNDMEFFAQVNIPVGVAVTDLQLTSDVERGDIGYEEIFNQFEMLPKDNSTAYGPHSLVQAFKGGNTIGTDYIGLKYGKIDGRQSTGVQLGDVKMSLGMNLVHNEDVCWGIAARGVAPLGNVANGEYIQAPIFGNGGYWHAGLQTMGHFVLWNNNESELRLNFDAWAVHLFANKKGKRSFDTITNGNGSKYLLVADYVGADSDAYVGASGEAAPGGIQNLINFSTLKVNSSFAAEFDALVAFSLISEGFTFDLGYEFWGRTKEKLSLIDTFDNQRFAILGQQRIFSGGEAGIGNNWCEPAAKMGKLQTTNDNGSETILNATVAANRIASTDLDIVKATAPAVYTSTAFANAQYQWDTKHFTPHVGLHASWEFSHSKNQAIPTVGVAINAGVAF